MFFSIISLNARGLRNGLKRKALFLFIKQLKVDFAFLQESHSNIKDTSLWKAQWGSDIWFSHGTEHSAGVSDLKGHFGGEMLQSLCDKQGHNVCLVCRIRDIVFILVNIYGYNRRSENDELLGSLDAKLTILTQKYLNAHLIIGGDFNIVLNESLDRWPPGKPSLANSSLKTLMNKYDLYDVWREKFPRDRVYTWSNKDGSRQSRLDYWLVSNSLDKDSITVDLLPTPLTDHKAVLLNVNLSRDNLNVKHFSYWKMNCSLLKRNSVKTELQRLIKRHWDQAQKDKIYGKNWELLKYEIGKYMRKYGSNLAKSRRKEVENITSEMTSLTSFPPDSLSAKDRLRLTELQTKLDDLYKCKAEGAFVRSRQKWLEEGEQMTSYFFKLEKSRAKHNSLSELNISGSVINDKEKISEFCYNNSLYKTKFDHNAMSSFFSYIDSIRAITHAQKLMCDSLISQQEVQDAILNLKNNRSPGNDGISSEFYKEFSDLLAPFLFKVFF